MSIVSRCRATESQLLASNDGTGPGLRMVCGVTLPRGLGSVAPASRQRLVCWTEDEQRPPKLLEDDAAAPVQSGHALVSGSLRAVKLLASDGRMNMSNDCRSRRVQ